MPKELSDMDTGKEVHVQDGEEHVAFNSMAASEINGDVGIKKQGEESEEGTRPAAIGAAAGANYLHPLVLEESESDAIGAAAGASYLHPLVLEESESDSEEQTWINHPSSSPEGSVLHALYFQLLGAGFHGLIEREFLRSRVVRTWREAAFEKSVAALAEPEMEFDQETHQSMGDMQMPSRAIGNQDDDSNGEQLQQQIPQQIMPESVPGRHHVVAKKTAAIVRRSKFQGLSSTRTTRPLPLPLHIGVRRKTPVKKNKGYLKNRLQ